VREELRETEKKLTKIVDDNINKALEEMGMMMMERMMTKKDKHSEGLKKERKHRRELHFQREEGVVVIFAIVIPIHYLPNVIISIELELIPMGLRLTIPLSTEKTMLKNI